MIRQLYTFALIYFLIFSALLPLAASAEDQPVVNEWSIHQLEKRLNEIDKKLSTLSHFTIRLGEGSIGYRARGLAQKEVHKSVTITWDQSCKIDEIVLVPVIQLAEIAYYTASGFPAGFSISCGTSDSGNETRIATFSEADELLPRIAPLVIPCNGIEASWIRIDTSQLSKDMFSTGYNFQMAEILVFSGDRNVALQGKVMPADDRRGNLAWRPENLIDGFFPCLMDSAAGAPSSAIVSEPGSGKPATITIDLEDAYTIDRIQFHAPFMRETFPYKYESTFAIPKLLVVQGSLQPDFNTQEELLVMQRDTRFKTGPIMVHNIEPVKCRYVKLVAKLPYYASAFEDPKRTRFGFAEVQLFSGDKNVALGKPCTLNFAYFPRNESPDALTDGHNLYGNILSIRAWLNELALRHELEKERPVVAAELKLRYLRQEKHLKWLACLVLLLGVAIVFGFFLAWVFRQRAIQKTRERIAADIHDELGANLHAIGLMGNLARMLKKSPEEQEGILIRLQEMANRTGLAAHHCTNVLESKELYKDIVEDMRHITERLVADLDHSIEFKGESLLRCLKPQKRIDLFLFYKECLTNIVRHSAATSISAYVEMTSSHLNVIISDNGRGTKGLIPKSLRRRARLIGAKIDMTTSDDGGTCVLLTRCLRSSDLMKEDLS